MTREYFLKTPIEEEVVRKLRVGDTIYIDGLVITARDAAHKRAIDYYEAKKEVPVKFYGNVLYHCGPLVKKIDEKWEIVSAGPTTSTRMEYIEPRFIEIFRPRIIVGKGGMGEDTTSALHKYGAIYAAYPGGVGVLAARSIKKILGVEWLDLGIPEALWVLEVENFGPLTVAIDAHKNNLYLNIRESSYEKLKDITSI
jgi:fumarate hydratase subunit beta